MIRAVVALPRALEEAVSSFFGSLSRSAEHGAVSPALLPIYRASRPIADTFMEMMTSSGHRVLITRVSCLRSLVKAMY
jgi:hypothetical protein